MSAVQDHQVNQTTIASLRNAIIKIEGTGHDKSRPTYLALDALHFAYSYAQRVMMTPRQAIGHCVDYVERTAGVTGAEVEAAKARILRELL